MLFKITPVVAAMLAVSVLSPFVAGAATFDELVQQLRDGNEVQRNIARQRIPREGADALRPVLPLLFHENPAVSWAAKNVVLDIANAVSVPGREAERAQVAKALLDALAATDNQDHQFLLLRILPVVVPEGADVAPIAALLQQEATRERARRALQETNTAACRAALREALPTADPTFACALMDALDKTGDTESFPLIRERFEGGTPEERTAAARALANSGDPALAAPFLKLASEIDINERLAMEDAVLELASTLATQGGTWEAGMALYRDLLAQSENPVIRGGALTGLGRYGDETALPTIMTAWAEDESGLLEAPAMAAIESLQDPAVTELLIATYPEQPVSVQERLLGIMGRKGDPRFLPLIEGADAISPAARIDALRQFQLPEAVPLLEALASEGGDTAAAAGEAIAALAESFRDAGNQAGTGRAYLALYRVAQDDAQKQAALEGIKRYPVPEAYEELKAVLGEQAFLNLPPAVLTGMARVLVEAGRSEEAKGLRTALISRANDTASVQALIQLGPVEGSHEDFARQLGFINQWKIAAPFPLAEAPDDGQPVLNDGRVDLATTYGEGDTAQGWIDRRGDGAQAIVTLMDLGGDQSRAFAYATVHVDSAQDAVLRLGSDDGVRAWVNGEKVHENITDRGVALDADQVPVKLKAGDNAVLLEIIQHAGGWAFCARLTRPDGTPLPFEQK